MNGMDETIAKYQDCMPADIRISDLAIMLIHLPHSLKYILVGGEWVYINKMVVTEESVFLKKVYVAVNEEVVQVEIILKGADPCEWV